MSDTRPRGRLEPPTPSLREALDAIGRGETDRAEQALEGASEHMLWMYYLRGRVAHVREQYDSAIQSLLELKKMVADAARAPNADELRLAAMALKQLGSIARQRDEFVRAIGYHATEYGYLLHAGSFLDLHDAAISLDVDHFFAGDAPGSLCWGERSLEFARQIPDEQTRHRCEGMSLNNLAMWHADIGDPEVGIDLAKQSLACWTAYEGLAGTDENRVVWAEYGVGYAFAKLAESTDPDDAEAEARARYRRALDIARDRGMSEDAVQPIIDAKAEL
jgi:tetratricopeptide (TPR) repeat protein